MLQSIMRQRRKRSRAAGLCRCAFCTFFTFVSVLGAVFVSRNAFSVAAEAAAREAPDQRVGIRLTLRKDATWTNQRRRQIKVTGAGAVSFAAGETETETAVPPFPPLSAPPPPQATTTHVVVASFGEPEPYHAVSLYFASKLAGATVHHVVMHTYGKGHEPGELNLKVAEEVEGATAGAAATAAAAERKQARNYHQQPSVPWRTIYHRLRVHRHNIDLSLEDSYHALARSYLHSSAREVDYELLCFARFIGLHRFCTERGIDELTFLDADVIVFDREFLTKVRIPANHSLWTVHDRSSFLASLTCSSIGDFVDYMVDFYQQRDRRKIVSTIDTYGDDELDPTKLQGLRDREPAFDVLRIKPKLFSDMYLFERFLNDQFAHSRIGGGKEGKGEEERGHILLGSSVSKQSSTGVAKTPQATTLPRKLKVKQGGEEEARAATTLLGAAVDDQTTPSTTPVLPPYVYYWNPSVEKYNNYFTLMVNMRYVTQVPHTRAWLCLNQALFDAHFKISKNKENKRKRVTRDSFKMIMPSSTIRLSPRIEKYFEKKESVSRGSFETH